MGASEKLCSHIHGIALIGHGPDLSLGHGIPCLLRASTERVVLHLSGTLWLGAESQVVEQQYIEVSLCWRCIVAAALVLVGMLTGVVAAATAQSTLALLIVVAWPVAPAVAHLLTP